MGAERELTAAGIDAPGLRAAYRRCRELNASHGRTYYLAARLLAPDQRPAVHALYGFARMVDDVLDVEPDRPENPRQRRLAGIEGDLRVALSAAAGTPPAAREQHPAADPVTAAVAHTATRYRIDPGLFEEFLAAMRMDLTVTDYPSLAALGVYMRGSAEVIGLQMLPVLGTRGPRAEAEPAAAALGTAFQLTNFLRDVGEDLDRGRVYLPADLLAAHGVDRELLLRCRAQRRTDPRVRAALAELVAHTRAVYRFAETGLPLLRARSRPCVRTALRLYGRILDLIEAAGHDVLNHRVVVSRRRRAAVALPALARVAVLASLSSAPRAPLAGAGRSR